jgi:hypothetical protein
MKLPTESKIKIVVLLAVSGLICLGVGEVVLVSPDTTATRIGYAFVTAGGKSEFMTFYGGFYTGIGLFLLLATRIRSLRPGAVSFLALSATAAIPVRIYSLVQFGVSYQFSKMAREISSQTSLKVGTKFPVTFDKRYQTQFFLSY